MPSLEKTGSWTSAASRLCQGGLSRARQTIHNNQHWLFHTDLLTFPFRRVIFKVSRLHQTSPPKSSAHVGWAALDGSDSPAVFFSEVFRIRTADPVFSSFPANAQLAKRIADGFFTDRSAGDANRNAYLGCQIQRPDTRVFAEGARTLV